MRYRFACFCVMAMFVMGIGAALAVLMVWVVLNAVWSRLGMVLLVVAFTACTHAQPTAQPSGPITEVVLPAHVPGWAKFCIEELYLTAPLDGEVFIRRSLEPVCKWTVDDIRRWAIKQRAADE